MQRIPLFHQTKKHRLVSYPLGSCQHSYNVKGWHDDVIKWKYFPRYWSFVLRIHRSPVNSPHKAQWRGALMFSLICALINDWANNPEANELGRHRAHYDIIAMLFHTCGKLPLRSYQYSDNVKHIEGSYSPVDPRLNPAMFGFMEGVPCSGRRLTTQYTSLTEHCSDTGQCVYYSGITWALWCFKTPITRLFMFASFKTKNLSSLVICEGNDGFPINKGH